jgi:hypothetical protein
VPAAHSAIELKPGLHIVAPKKIILTCKRRNRQDRVILGRAHGERRVGYDDG